MRWYSNTGSIPASLVVAAAAKSLQLCPTLCDPIEGSLPGSAVPGILQARTLEWVAISFSNRLKWKVKVKLLSHVRLLATPWTAAHQAPPFMGFPRQEYQSGVPLPSPASPVATSQIILYVAARVTFKRHQFISSSFLKLFRVSHSTENKIGTPFSGLKTLADSPTSTDGILLFSHPAPATQVCSDLSFLPLSGN